MSLPPRCSVLILDLGDVLFTWSPATTTSISVRMFKAILSSTIWRQYERGTISEDECYRLSAERFSLDLEELRHAFVMARASLQSNNAFIHFVCDLQAEAQGALRIFAMSNISAPDYAYIRTMPIEWGMFERVFTSADAGMRKPDLCFFKFVLGEIKAEPSSVVFVDDQPENVLAARSLGMNGIVFDNIQHVQQSLRFFTCDPVSRGRTFLEARAGQLESETNSGHTVVENFTQLLIWEATNRRELVNFIHYPRTWNFFREGPILTTDEYPCDMDTTSFGLMMDQPDDRVVNSVMDEMLQYTSQDGITMTYFDPERTHTDPVVALNVLRLFYSRGRGHELSRTFEWVLGVLKHRAYIDGTRYYETAESFLFFASQFLRFTTDAHVHRVFAPLLRERIRERAGATGDALALSMRVLAGVIVGVRLERELTELLPMQCEDGGWSLSWAYRYGRSGIKIGNRGLTTAFALNAIAALRSTPQPQALTIPERRTPEPELEDEPLTQLRLARPTTSNLVRLATLLPTISETRIRLAIYSYVVAR